VEFKNVEMFAEWWVKCGMRNLDCNCRSENLVNLQIFVDACCAILMIVLKTAIYITLRNRIFTVNLFDFNVYGLRCLKSYCAGVCDFFAFL